MSLSPITIVDYGRGNLLSVRRAFEFAGASVIFANTPEEIMASNRLILPGVGAFGDAMRELNRLGLVNAIQAYAEEQRPLLGICVGMQLLFEFGEEFGRHQGLGLLAGRISAIPDFKANGEKHKIPHVGWGRLSAPATREWDGTILHGLDDSTYCYFIHSFSAIGIDESDSLAICDYDGFPIHAAVGRGNLWGCQFHPEKSGEAGLRISENFLRVE